MDEEMEELVGDFRFGELELDFDYEFDSPRFFDFCRGETAAEVMAAERWFASAPSYPPSPYVVRLSERECLLKESAYSVKPTEERNTDTNEFFCGTGQAACLQKDEGVEGPAFCDHMEKEVSKPKTKRLGKASLPRRSTLMKPTASILAKQNQAQEAHVRTAQRFGMPPEKPTFLEIQASKRQKLEGGLLCKVVHMHPQPNWTHKVAKKNVLAVSHSEPPRLKLTIPIQPELSTAQRAKRFRPNQGTDVENTSLSAQILKERSGQKIPKASSILPRQKGSLLLSVFQVAQKESNTCLKPRKMQCERPERREHQRHESNGSVSKFKALPLNQKIFSSKGDMGVFVTSKPQLTKPVAFNFSTDKRFSQNPPTELFSKMSLTDIKQDATCKSKILRPPHTPKVAKENVSNSSQHGLKDFRLSRNTVEGYRTNTTNAHEIGRTLTEIRSGDNIYRCGVRHNTK